MQLSRAVLAAAFACAVAADAVHAGVPPAETPASVHVGAALGAGTAYDGLGVNLQVRGEHVGASVGIGAMGLAGGSLFDVSGGSSSGLCASLRWFKEDGEGLFISLNGTWASFNSHYDPFVQQSQLMSGHAYTATAVIGGRWRWTRLFAEAGLGAGGSWLSTPPHGSSGSPPAGSRNTEAFTLIPDVSLGAGVEF
jgi:hypothetical protein